MGGGGVDGFVGRYSQRREGLTQEEEEGGGGTTSAAMARGREQDVPTRRREGAYCGAGDREQCAHNATLHGKPTTPTTGGRERCPPGVIGWEYSDRRPDRRRTRRGNDSAQ
jgi:hypothetical protein